MPPTTPCCRQVAVIFFSRRGRFVTLANVIAEGVRQVCASLPPRPQRRHHAPSLSCLSQFPLPLPALVVWYRFHSTQPKAKRTEL